MTRTFEPDTVLAAHLAAIRDNLDQRSRPYLDAQQLRADKTELLTRVRAAAAELDDRLDCTCVGDWTCAKHYVLAILAGDL